MNSRSVAGPQPGFLTRLLEELRQPQRVLGTVMGDTFPNLNSNSS